LLHHIANVIIYQQFDITHALIAASVVRRLQLPYQCVKLWNFSVSKNNLLILYFSMDFTLLTWVAGCFVYALLGSTHAITIRPTALMALVTYDSGDWQMGPEAAILLAFFTGCIILLFGLLNFGNEFYRM
jgi:MFS superfamily sulfate permease-like transporter